MIDDGAIAYPRLVQFGPQLRLGVLAPTMTACLLLAV